MKTIKGKFLQAPIRNESLVGAQVYSHSGEYSPSNVDFALPSRGLSFHFMRQYRSALSSEQGPLGRGWTFSHAKRIEEANGDLLYHDGLGRVHHFVFQEGRNDYASSVGFYSILQRVENHYQLIERYATTYGFDRPKDGGRLKYIRDRNSNTIAFQYDDKGQRVLVTDPLKREITIQYDRAPSGNLRVTHIIDHTGRKWNYVYDKYSNLINVLLPPVVPRGDRPKIVYEYDDSHLLVSITDPNGNTFVRNTYDKKGRVVRQNHGNGEYRFRYEDLAKTDTGFTIYCTHVRQKNNAQLVLEHNSTGNVVKRTLFVSSESLSDEENGPIVSGKIPLTTESDFNKYGELTKRVFPSGEVARWIYDEEAEDPRERGNLLNEIRTPAPGVDSDQDKIVTSYTYERSFQLRKTITDPHGKTVSFDYDERGNIVIKKYPPVSVQKISSNGKENSPEKRQLVERFEYNASGQIILLVDSRGATTEYWYYSKEDSVGSKGPKGISRNRKRAGGHLARVVQDPKSDKRKLRAAAANLIVQLAYDERGNITSVQHGKGNPTQFRYDGLDRLVTLISRAPIKEEMTIKYDANGNPTDASVSFDRLQFDDKKGELIHRSTLLQQRLEYNILNNVIAATVAREGHKDIVERFERDENENIVRKIQPMGNIAEYRFDERNLLLERRLAVGTDEETIVRYTYTRQGWQSSRTDERGNTLRHEYDGFHRYRGFINAEGTRKWQVYDPNGNLVRIQAYGNIKQFDAKAQPMDVDEQLLSESSYQYDELNRCVSVNRGCEDVALGNISGIDSTSGQDGVISTVIEYGDNHRPARVLYGTGNVLDIKYDGTNRVVEASDTTGAALYRKYDDKGNVIRMSRVGPEIPKPHTRFMQEIHSIYDEKDRLVERSINSEPPERFEYNEFGMVTQYTGRANQTIHMLQDDLGRLVGRVANVLKLGTALKDRIELDDNGRVVGRVNREGHHTKYEYDDLNRRSSIKYPDGNSKVFRRDSAGNVVEICDQNGNVIQQEFDSLNRLIRRTIVPSNKSDRIIEEYKYDGLNRIVCASSNGIVITRKYDSLSHLIEETQAGRRVSYSYDSAGNRVGITYPSGLKVQRGFDQLRRIQQVSINDKQVVAEYKYRTMGQLAHQQLGDRVAASFKYDDSSQRLAEVLYKAVGSGKIVDGYEYGYDKVGNCTHERVLLRPEDYGERYFYDSANRLVKVRYGVHDFDVESEDFERETIYELDNIGNWKGVTERNRSTEKEAVSRGRPNSRGAYLELGKKSFEYDPNGNRISETNSIDEDGLDWASRKYMYDYANRPVQIDFLNPEGRSVKSIEYVYDAFSRQVTKRVQENGRKRTYSRVWNGQQLIEEWEDGTLVKRFIYGARPFTPEAIDVFDERGMKGRYFYCYNGRGLVTALVDKAGVVNERYSYDVFGHPALIERNGEGLAIPGSFSPLGNPFFAAGQLWDNDIGLFMGPGLAYDPRLGQFINPDSFLGEPGLGNDYSGGLNPPSHPGIGQGGMGGIGDRMNGFSDWLNPTSRPGMGQGGIGGLMNGFPGGLDPTSQPGMGQGGIGGLMNDFPGGLDPTSQPGMGQGGLGGLTQFTNPKNGEGIPGFSNDNGGLGIDGFGSGGGGTEGPGNDGSGSTGGPVMGQGGMGGLAQSSDCTYRTFPLGYCMPRPKPAPKPPGGGSGGAGGSGGSSGGSSGDGDGGGGMTGPDGTCQPGNPGGSGDGGSSGGDGGSSGGDGGSSGGDGGSSGGDGGSSGGDGGSSGGDGGSSGGDGGSSGGDGGSSGGDGGSSGGDGGSSGGDGGSSGGNDPDTVSACGGIADSTVAFTPDGDSGSGGFGGGRRFGQPEPPGGDIIIGGTEPTSWLNPGNIDPKPLATTGVMATAGGGMAHAGVSDGGYTDPMPEDCGMGGDYGGAYDPNPIW